MRLSTIKLAGFKSFVDPTTLHLPSNLTAVVGPNGCGKSNIIDAVRWVMGESSASRLRGDNLADVIFSGSSSRKPVGQATVELIFDNSDASIVGEFARFNEISVKRSVSRDGNSAYYLNSTRCRRRDITDLFLGTGLGPRSYSIIEQGMISQIIEARPEDMRVYLEEAAGISKYKERRRETAQRIGHTRENLERLKDVRDEVAKRLEHLKRQARQAEQYQRLKAELRTREAELRALLWQGVDRELCLHRQAVRADELALESAMAGVRQTQAQLELCRMRQHEAQERLNQVQAESYRVGAEMARIEQQIQHQRELGGRLQRSHDESRAAALQLASHIASDEAELGDLRQAVALAEPELALRQQDETCLRAQLLEVETSIVQWQRSWDANGDEQSNASRLAEVGQARIELLENQAREAAGRCAALRAERGGIDLAALADAHAALEHRLESLKHELEALAALLEERKLVVADVQERQRQRQHELSEQRLTVQSQRGRLGSLEALQHAALGQEQGAGLDWVRQHGLERRPRLGECLQVDDGWETAVELVLGALIEGVLVDAPQELLTALTELGNGRVTLIAAESMAADSAVVGPSRVDPAEHEVPPAALAAHVRGPRAVREWLANFDALDDQVAVQHRLDSSTGRMAVSRDGMLIGPGIVSRSRSQDAHLGALLREREIQGMRMHINAASERETCLIGELSELKVSLLDAEHRREEAQRGLYLAHRSSAELAGQLLNSSGRIEAAEQRVVRIEREIDQLDLSATTAQSGVRDARAALELALERMSTALATRRVLEVEREGLDAIRERSRQAEREVREAAHGIALKLESQRAQIVALGHALSRMGQQRAQADRRQAELTAQIEGLAEPLLVMQQERQIALDQRVLVENDLVMARSAEQDVESERRALEQQRQRADQEAQALREQMQRLLLDEKVLDLRAQGLQAAIEESGLVLDAVLGSLPAESDIERWQQLLRDLESRIHRLEPVNLAAIQEYGEQAQRKDYLDSQHADLTLALDTLEEAMRKIDRETRGRFKDTFDRVNAGMQVVYPRLFGGGHAYLELTGEDLLDAGVAIMARPPGKRVSNISLLSGGEKALTAVALVFAIFRLNPAPFCLLDEVDAPLDEANVGRFCQLVTEMSEKVQFLIVTHNKASMESALQLAGVTMREAGVSRLVSVDIAQAVQWVGVA